MYNHNYGIFGKKQKILHFLKLEINQ